VEDLGIKFTSNLISSNANLDLTSSATTLNDYIAIGSMYVSWYLTHLQNHSGDSTINKQVICKYNGQWEP
jgi:hypothetical protein